MGAMPPSSVLVTIALWPVLGTERSGTCGSVLREEGTSLVGDDKLSVEP